MQLLSNTLGSLALVGSCLAQGDWTQMSPTTSPSARVFHTMAYDALRQRTVAPVTSEATVTAQSPVAPTADHSARVDKLFERWNRDDSPGAAVLVLHAGKVVHRKGYGIADLEHRIPIAPDTVFDIASVSKQFCGLAIALLAEQGRLSMDDDVRKHVAWVPDFGGRKITIRNLVYHTSGIRDWPGTLRLGGWRYDDVISFEQILNMLRKQRDLNFDPGAEYSYSNTGYNLLAHVVEKTSGVSFAKWTKGHFFDPLGMRDTHFHDDHTRVVTNRATAYKRVNGEWKRVTNNLTAVGSSSLFTTIDDVAKWALNFETKKIGGEAAIKRMHTRGTLNDGRRIPYCFGVSKESHGGLETVAHSGSWAGFKTYLIRYPEQRFAVVILANTDTVNPVRKSHEVASIYLEDQMKPDAGGPATGAFARRGGAPNPTAEQLKQYAGRYHSVELDTTYTIEPGDAALAMRHFRNEDVTLRPSPTTDQFRGNTSWAGSVAFVRGDGNAIVALLVSSGRCRNVRFERVREDK